MVCQEIVRVNVIRYWYSVVVDCCVMWRLIPKCPPLPPMVSLHISNNDMVVVGCSGTLAELSSSFCRNWTDTCELCQTKHKPLTFSLLNILLISFMQN